MKVDIDQLTETELLENEVFTWPIWEHDEDKFDWYYDKTEYCYIIEGEATITTEFDSFFINDGDFVIFPKGLECVWDIHSAIKKYYSFEE